MNMLKIAAVAVVAATAAMLVGCGPSKPRTHVAKLVVSTDSTLNDKDGTLAPVLVDLVGLTGNDAELKSYSIDAWIGGSDDKKKAAAEFTKQLRFDQGNPGPVVVNKNDPIWKVWQSRGIQELMIIASSRNMAGGDARRKVIPMTTNRWKVDTIDIKVTSGGVDVPTKMEPLPQ